MSRCFLFGGSCKGIFEPGAGKVRVSPHPSSPKYDELKLVCGLKVCIVGFRGCALAERVMRKHWDECPGVFCLGEVAKGIFEPGAGKVRVMRSGHGRKSEEP